jgi:hypothetical protein
MQNYLEFKYLEENDAQTPRKYAASLLQQGGFDFALPTATGVLIPPRFQRCCVRITFIPLSPALILK